MKWLGLFFWALILVMSGVAIIYLTNDLLRFWWHRRVARERKQQGWDRVHPYDKDRT